MSRWPLLLLPIHVLASVLPVLAGKPQVYGVSPALAARYAPSQKGSTRTWECLDGSKSIEWSAVNDDYCDCPDGSDEPGTSACPNSSFYCVNEGHIGASIPSIRVKDGLCEPECCDGSDEASGVCPDKCKEVGEAYRERMKAQNKLRKTGSKIRSTYIAFAHKEKKRIEQEIAQSAQDITAREKEVAHLKEVVQRTESLTAAALEEKKKSPLYESFMTHVSALKSLKHAHQKHLEREKALGDILDSLRTGYNPNYQDMAVLEAVRGWEHHANLPHINDVKKEGEEVEEAETDEAPVEEEESEEGMWTETQLEHQLDGLLTTDYDTLLLEHEKHIGTPISSSILYNLSSYLPDPFVPQYEAFRDLLVSWLEMFGIAKGTSGAADASKAQKALGDAEYSLDLKRRDKEKIDTELVRLFDPEWYGADGEWKKLDKTCIEKELGDYIYEVCLFDEARQRASRGGSTFSLGRFSSWNKVEGVETGSPEYYNKQHYTRGNKCWNGPMRSVTLDMSCGLENAILAVSEPEKCEYEFKVTSPALCLPPTAEDHKKEEL